MKMINENRLKKVKLFLIYEVIYNEIQYNNSNKVTHSLTNNRSIRSIRNINELKECDF